MSNKPWEFLKPGDIIDIIAPSSSVLTPDLDAYYIKAKQALESIGLVARIPKNLIDRKKDPFSSNSLENRLDFVIKAFEAEDSKAVWAIRGGYGAAKLIPYLEKIEAPLNPKVLLGFSDITVLHLFLNNKWGWNTMHAPVINGLVTTPQFLAELKPILFGEQKTINYNNLKPLNEMAKQQQDIAGKITGGNLSIIQTSIKTSWEIEGQDKIIFIEEVGEEVYRIDRMLNHLLQAGVFNKAKAIIFGQMIPPSSDEESINLCNITIENFAKSIDIPVLSTPIIGHNSTLNSPLPLGTICYLTLGNEPYLSCISGGTNLFEEQ